MGIEKNNRVLVIDDSVTNNLLCKSILEENGYLVEVTEDSSMTIELLDKFKPSVLLLDLMMPNLNGFDVLDMIKSVGYDGLSVVIISAKDDDASFERAHALGAKDYITKPISIKKLTSIVAKYAK